MCDRRFPRPQQRICVDQGLEDYWPPPRLRQEREYSSGSGQGSVVTISSVPSSNPCMRNHKDRRVLPEPVRPGSSTKRFS